MKSLKRLCAFSAAALCAGLALAQEQEQQQQAGDEQRPGADKLYAVRSKMKWGFIDRTGKLVIEPKYDMEVRFGDGLAVVTYGLMPVEDDKVVPGGGLVEVPVSPEGIRWEIIDASGKTVAKLPADRDYAGSVFSEGLAWFYVWRQGRGSVYGYMDRGGRVVIEPQFRIPGHFRDGLAEACTAFDRCGFIDRAGRFAVQPMYKEVRPFSEGLAVVVTHEGLAGFVNRGGEVVIPPQFEPRWTSDFGEGLAAAAVAGSNKYGYIDRLGRFRIQPEFEAAGPFADGLAPAMSGGKWGYIDREGKFVIPPQFAHAAPFSEGRAGVSTCPGATAASRGDTPCGFGYIDRTGRFVIEQRFELAEPFRDGVARVIEEGGRGYVDREGNFIWKPGR